MIKIKCLLFSLPIILTGCAIDPSQCNSMDKDASLILKARCDHGGVYQANIDKKKLSLAEQQRLNKMFRAVYDAVAKESSEVRAELRGQKAEYGQLKNALGSLLQELEKNAQGNKKLKEEIDAAKQQLENIEQGDSPAVMQKQAELESLRMRVSDLESAFE